MKIRLISGLTLLETITVILIISVLAAIMFPAFAGAKRSSKVVRTQAQLRQWAMVGQLYAMDNDPPLGCPVTTPPSLLTFVELRLVPARLLDTGAGHPRSAYTFVYPSLPAPPLEAARWIRHVDQSGGNPIVMIDVSQDKRIDDRPHVMGRRYTVYGVNYEGTLRTVNGTREEIYDLNYWIKP